MIEHTGITIYQRSQVMSDKELERMINAAGLIGAIIGFASGAGLMMMVGIIF